MRPYVIIRYGALAVLLDAAFLLIAAVLSAANGDSSFFPLAYSFLIAALFGVFPLIFIPAQGSMSLKEGLSIVVYSWILSCLIGVMPYMMWGGEFTLTNAWFESVSGFTTTGSSILTDVEALPLGLLFWRSATHWIGGIGIIVFALAVLPPMGIAGMVLYRSEMSDPALYEFSLNARKSVHILLRVYVGLTVLETVALMLCGMGPIDAVMIAFATIATGGFAPRNASIAYYNSMGVEIVVVVFMILSGIHFGLLFSATRGNLKEAWKSSVVRFYIPALLLGSVLTAFSVYGDRFPDAFSALRYAAFQVISLGTSTGFATTDTSVWPSMAQLILIFFTLQCACAGSTSGGIKVDRIVVFLKSVIRRFRETIHPRAVFSVKLSGRAVDDSTVSASLLYVAMYICFVFVSSLLLTWVGVDSLEAFSGSAATMGNVGPGFGSVGSTGNFAQIPAFGKWVLSCTMLLGRLEIYGLLAFLMPSFWK